MPPTAKGSKPQNDQGKISAMPTKNAATLKTKLIIDLAGLGLAADLEPEIFHLLSKLVTCFSI